jgi:hypothetical protein
VAKQKLGESRPGMKRCNRCNEWRLLDDFHKASGKPDGRRQPCRFCRTVNGGRKRRYQGPSQLTINGEARFRCCLCGEFLPRQVFHWRKDGTRRGVCRPCGVRDAREWGKRNIDRVVARTLERRIDITVTGSYQNSRASRRELLRAIAPRYRHYVRSEKNRLKKRLTRKINMHDKALRLRYSKAKLVRDVSIDDFLDFILQRKPFCECCGKALDMTIASTDFAIDHFHDTGLLRGLLCNPCNLGIGSFNDDISTLIRAKQYLERHHAKRNLPEV